MYTQKAFDEKKNTNIKPFIYFLYKYYFVSLGRTGPKTRTD